MSLSTFCISSSLFVYVSHSSIDKFLNLTLPIAEKQICKNVSLTCKHKISSDDDAWENVKEKVNPRNKFIIWISPYYKVAVIIYSKYNHWIISLSTNSARCILLILSTHQESI